MKKKGRRIQPLTKLLLFGVFIILCLILIVSTAGRNEFNSPHKLVVEVIGTGQAGVTGMLNTIENFWHGYISLWDVRAENQKLRAELNKHKVINAKYREAMAVNIRLTKLLDLKESLPPPTISAQIIGKDPSKWFKTIIVNRGASDGIVEGMPVVTAEGIVGQVMNASPHYAKVLLANDANSAIDALIQKTRVQGIIKGRGNEFRLNYVFKSSEVAKGDIIVTSGLGDVFPKGLPVGTIKKVTNNRRGMFQQIEVTPAVDFSQLEYIVIILKSNSLTE